MAFSCDDENLGIVQRVLFAAALAVSILLPGSIALAQQQHTSFQPGDIIAGGQTPSRIEAFGRFDWFLPTGALNKRVAETFDEYPFDFAFDSNGRLYSPTFFTVRVFDQRGAFLGNFPRFFGNAFGAIAFDRTGNAFIGVGTFGGNLVKASPGGDLLSAFLLPADGTLVGGVASLDLAQDQCTLFYTSAGRRVMRYDVCHAQPITDLNSALPGSQASALRILPDSSVIVADMEAIYRLNEAGSIIQTYDVPGEDSWYRVALDVGGGAFFATSRNSVYKFDVVSGARLNSFTSSDYLFDAVGVVGEPRAATAQSVSIPMLSPWLLLGVAICLAVAGAFYLRN